MLTIRSRVMRFSMKTLLLVTLCFGLAFGWLRVQTYKKRVLVASIQRLGGHVRFAYDGAEINFASSPVPRKKRVGPIWLHESMGVDVFNRIVGVHLDGTNATDSDLQFLAGWENLQTLDLDGTAISDVGLERIGRLTKLRQRPT